MTLLEVISRAAAAAEADGGGNRPPPPKYSIILNPDEVFSQLKPDAERPETPGGVSLIKRVSGWKISEFDAAIAELASLLSENLRKKLSRPKSFSKGDFLGLLNSFLTKSAEKIGLSIDSDAADIQFARAGIEKLGFLIGRDVAGLIAESCVVVEVWEVLETLLLHGLLGNLNSMNLTEKLLEKNQTKLLCLLVKHVSDFRSSELLSVLKYFLSPTDESYDGMVAVRKQWESQALLAIEKATQGGLPKKVSRVAREASIILMMAYDGFSSPEVCLHYVFGSSNADGIVLSSAISRLDGQEVLDLIRYFMKWLGKYHRFPEARPCPSAGSVLGLIACESVPSLESIIKGLGLVLDEHFSHLVFNSEFHDEMRVAESIVSSLALEAYQSCPLDDIIKQLKSEIRKN